MYNKLFLAFLNFILHLSQLEYINSLSNNTHKKLT